MPCMREEMAASELHNPGPGSGEQDSVCMGCVQCAWWGGEGGRKEAEAQPACGAASKA